VSHHEFPSVTSQRQEIGATVSSPVALLRCSIVAARQDSEVVAALRSGDESVFARLVDEWSPAMLRLARMHVSTRESAEDVVQEGWMAALRGVDRFEGRSSLRTWVFQIVLNIAKTRGVKEHRVVPFSSAFGEGAGPTVDPERFQSASEPSPGGWRQFPAPWPTPESVLLSNETRAVIDSSLEHLPERQRVVIELRDVDGYEPEEVCTLLELTPGNQRILLHRARASVRRELELYFADSAQTQATP
jgi:RNA polymerase sigma-70 factor (ECF subfamily)